MRYFELITFITIQQGSACLRNAQLIDDRPSEVFLQARGFPKPLGYPHSWMVSFTENPKIKWMIWLYACFKKALKSIITLNYCFVF